MMGSRNFTGRGVLQNYVEAAKWFRLSADQDNADAQYFLGTMYRNGQGVAKDEVEAEKWFRLSAERGNADAQFNLGYIYHGLAGMRRRTTWRRRGCIASPLIKVIPSRS